MTIASNTLRTDGDTASLPVADAAAARSVAREDGRAEAVEGVPFSNTGQKIRADETANADETLAIERWRRNHGFELDGEWVEIMGVGRRPVMMRRPMPHEEGNGGAALIDWLAFTVRPPQDETHEWVIQELQRAGLIGVVDELPGGYAGYARKAQCQDEKNRLCLIAWGGKNQAGTVYVSFTGHGCARIKTWPEVQAWLERFEATITRLDLAYDDFQGKQINIRQAVDWYLGGGFSAGGRLPSHRVHGDWLLGDQARLGRTLELGSREGGKLVRIYEKGKQLGDPESLWVRLEVEWHNESRRIPCAALTAPGKFLAGAYECLRFLDKEQSRIETTQRAAKVSFDKAMSNGKQLAGKLLNLALEVYEGDYGEVVERLRRDGYPARVEPFWHAVKDEPAMLADLAGACSMAGRQQDRPHPTRGESAR